MSRILDGNFELVPFQDAESVTLHINHEYEDYDTHWHTAAEIVMPLEGEYRVVCNNHTYDLKTNDILFIPPGEMHSLYAPPKGVRLILMFNFSMINSIWGYSSMIPVLSQSLYISEEYKETRQQAVRLLQKVIDIYADQSEPLRFSLMYAQLIEFFVLLAHHHVNRGQFLAEARSGRQVESFDKLNTALNYINKNYTENIRIEDAADIAGFSKFHFSRLFKQFTGQSFNSYLNQRRVKAAESLLLDPRLSITDVALQSGFSSLSTFNRSFRTVKDCTPSEYKTYYQRRGTRKRKTLSEATGELFPTQDRLEQ